MLLFCLTLVLQFKKAINEEETFYSNSKAEKFVHESGIDNAFEPICNSIMAKLQKGQAEDQSWTIDSMIQQSINISKYLSGW